MPTQAHASCWNILNVHKIYLVECFVFQIKSGSVSVAFQFYKMHLHTFNGLPQICIIIIIMKWNPRAQHETQTRKLFESNASV